MSIFKRIRASVVATVDGAVASMENHDAVVEATLGDMRRATAKSKARLVRVSNDGHRLRTKLADLRASEARWYERAKSCAESDEAKALECLRRRKECLSYIDKCEEAIEQHANLETRLQTSIEKLEKRYQTLDQARVMMRTRQSAAEAFRSAEESGLCSNFVSIDDTLERWEARITEAEMETGAESDPNHFEKAFLDAEEREALEIELTEIKQSR